jgi:hypothetical protein
MVSIGDGGESRVVERRVISTGRIADPDLPAEIAEDLAEGVGLISLPALGPAHARKRTRDAIVMPAGLISRCDEFG